MYKQDLCTSILVTVMRFAVHMVGCMTKYGPLYNASMLSYLQPEHALQTGKHELKQEPAAAQCFLHSVRDFVPKIARSLRRGVPQHPLLILGSCLCLRQCCDHV